MAFASSLFCSSKFLEHTHTPTKRLTVLGRTYPFHFRFLAHFTLMLEFLFYVKILVGDIEGGAKKTLSSKKKHNSFFLFFLLGAVFCAPL